MGSELYHFLNSFFSNIFNILNEVSNNVCQGQPKSVWEHVWPAKAQICGAFSHLIGALMDEGSLGLKSVLLLQRKYLAQQGSRFVIV